MPCHLIKYYKNIFFVKYIVHKVGETLYCGMAAYPPRNDQSMTLKCQDYQSGCRSKIENPIWKIYKNQNPKSIYDQKIYDPKIIYQSYIKIINGPQRCTFV